MNGRGSVKRGNWRHMWLPLAAIVGVYLTLNAFRTGAFDPGGQKYGYNRPGDVRHVLIQLTIEMFFFYAVLRPWSYKRSWKRVVVGLVVWLPWTTLSTAAMIHSGTIISMHALWCWLVLIGLFVTLFVSRWWSASGSRAMREELASHP